jgi:predicted O-methyltransferase YrrM
VAREHVKNIIISGTNFWNPGDDFVRDGVIRILREVFNGQLLNFHFYNFNQDFFPHDKFTGISNTVSKGDLEQYSDFVDAIVIAGLSAGNEVKDMYTWIVSNGLQDRVYLIGAGYENNYVAKFIYEEPEATIFRNARVIVGRTRKTPAFIPEMGLPYHHLNCPALLSVKNVKTVPEGKQIERIGFSIQLPHEVGILNHCCSESMYHLAVTTLLHLSKLYQVEIIAHHKSEYFHFLKLLTPYGINVLYSSFYQDLFDIYPRYDLVITTRLHSSLFANGHGIPGIIINDTDRHTHCLEGFPHSIWVNNVDALVKAIRSFNNQNLRQISLEATQFKEELLDKYLKVLRMPFGTAAPPQCAAPDTARLKEDLIADIGCVKNKELVLDLIQRLTPDSYLYRNIENYKRSIEQRATWFDNLTFLNWYARTFRPKHYLEVGVRRGRSIVQVLSASPETTAYGFDMWIADYAGEPNEGPNFVLSELRKAGIASSPTFISGDSKLTLPHFFTNRSNPQQLDLIQIDGDHSYAGAKADLDIAFDHLAPGGAIVFDDINHPSHPYLLPLWQEYRQRYPEYLFIEDMSGNGTGCCFKPPFDALLHHFDSQKKN